VDQHHNKAVQTNDQMQHKEEIIDLHQLLKHQCHEFVKLSIGAKKHVGEQAK
jgi:hypothetical protein